jgi:hypothetical protein
VHKLILNVVACSLAGNLCLALAGAEALGGVADSMAAESHAHRPPSDDPSSGPAAVLERPEHSGATTNATKAPAGLQRLEELNLLSEALVAKAGSGSTPAHEFRIEARMYRELLRQTMLSDRERPVNAQMPQPLLLDMVRMSALLHSAADCKTGFVITCPADLMLQLKSQQAKVTQGLNMTKMMYE